MSDGQSIFRTVPLAVIFDFDDTLFNTELSVETLLMPTLEKYGITAQQVDEARQAAHRDNDRSLDIIQYVVQRCGQQVWGEVRREYETHAKDLPSLLLPHAQEAMDILAHASIPFGIETYGIPELQEMKRKAVTLPGAVPFHVIDHRKKGKMLDRTYNEATGRFEIEWLDYGVNRVVMFENDPTAFDGLQSHVRAGRVLPIWIPTPRDKVKSAPIEVSETKDLAEGMSRLAEWVSDPRLYLRSQ